MARKPKHEEHENHERWLVSYADFITLLFAFFVVMYSISSVNEGKYRVLSDAVVAAFQDSKKSLKPIQVGKVARSPQSANLDFKDTAHPIKTPESPISQVSRANKTEGENKEDEVDFAEFAMADERMVKEGDGADGESGADMNGLSAAQLSEIAYEIEEAMQPLIDRDLISVKRNKRWIEVEINTDILFASGSARVQAQSLPVLEALSRILAAFPNDMRIEGFTDNVAIKSPVYPSNWELSAARASSVVRIFSAHGVEPERMAAIGYGEFRPLVSNETLEGRVKNRRVMVVITANRHMKRPKRKVERIPVEADEPLPETAAEPQPETAAEPLPETAAEPQLEIAEEPQLETTDEALPEVADESGLETTAEVLNENDFLRLDALIGSSGLHRTTPFSVDDLKPSEATEEDSSTITIPAWVPAPLVTPPVKFLSPISIPAVKVSSSLSSPLDSPSGGK